MENAVTNLRQTDAKLTIIGKVAESSLEKGTTKEGKECIKGVVSVQVDELNTIPLDVNTLRYTKDGKENTAYKGLETFMNKVQSIAQVGLEDATEVRATGNLALSSYKGNDGMIHEGSVKFRGGYFGSLKEGDKPMADLNIEIYVNNIIPEVSRDGEETGRLLVNGWSAQYDSKIGAILEPVQLVVPAEIATAFDGMVEAGQTIRLFCDVINTNRTIVTEIPTAFGKPRIEKRTEYKREFVVSGGQGAYDEDQQEYINPEVIRAAMQVRNERLEALKNADNKPAGTANKAAQSTKTVQW